VGVGPVAARTESVEEAGVSEEMLCIVLAARLTPLQTDVLLDTVLLGRGSCALAPEYGVSPAAVHKTLLRARHNVQILRQDAVAA
jgi:hypothetical protein